MQTDFKTAEHRHYFTNAVQIKNAFEPYTPKGALKRDLGVARIGLPQLYKMVEYAYMGCNCGAVRKSVVITEVSND